MLLELRRRAMLQLHLSDQQIYCLLVRVILEVFYGNLILLPTNTKSKYC